MAQVTITINSREYPIACESGQEGRIMQLSGILEEKAQLLKGISGQINENMLLAMIGILVADDLIEARKAAAHTNTAPVPAPAPTPVDLTAIDTIVSEKLKLVSDKIKAVAKQIESL